MELTLVLPVILFILVGAIDVGRLFFAYVTIQNAAKEGALFGASRPECTTAGTGCGNPNNTTWHVTADLSGITGTTLAVTCIDGSNGTSKAPTSCLSGDSYQVTVTDPFTFILPLAQTIIQQPLPLGATASSVVLNDAYVPPYRLGVGKSSATTTITDLSPVSYTYLITNTGTSTVTGIAATDDNVSSAGVTCPQTSLAPGASMSCSASHTVTAAELTAGGNLSNIVTVTSNKSPAVSASLDIPIEMPAACTPPTVSISASPTSGSGGSLSVTLTGTASGTPQSWLWDFGDGSPPSHGSGLTSPNTVQHTYVRTVAHGSASVYFSPTLTVTTGATCSTTQTTANHYITVSP